MKHYVIGFFILVVSLLFRPDVQNCSALTLDEFDTYGKAEVINALPSNASANVTAPSAIGGNRLLYIARTSDFNGGTTNIFSNTKLFHSQDGGVRALSRVTWDKDPDSSNPINTAGLGSVDFTQDSGDTFKLRLSCDFANGKPVDITLKFFDYNDPSTSTYTQITFTLNQVLENFDLDIPFSIFETSGPANLVGPAASTIQATVFSTISGLTILKRTGAVMLEINGQKGDSDINIDFIKTNGICGTTPDADGDVIDDCGVCKGAPGYKTPKDDCGLCIANPLYNKAKDDCGICFGNNSSKDDCGLCPSSPNYTRAKDPCGVCFGNGSSCADCSGTPNGTAKYDICNVCGGNGTTCLDCAGTPFGTLSLDACKVCGGTISDPAQCNVIEQCQTVEASSEILAYEKRLVEQATALVNKYKGEKNRNNKHQCGINTKPSDKKVLASYQIIKKLGEDIFSKGVEVCGEDCITVSFADQVIASIPFLKVIETETKSMAKKVQACYKRKNIKTAQQIAGIQSTVNQVKKDLVQLIKDCKDTQVCPK